MSSVRTCVMPYSSSWVGEEGSVILGLIRVCKRSEMEDGLGDVQARDWGDLCDGGGLEDLHGLRCAVENIRMQMLG